MGTVKSLVKSTAISFGVALIATTLVTGPVYNRVNGTVIEKEKIVIEPKPTVIYDKDGNVMARFDKERKAKTTYEEIPKEVIDAIIATEDRDFFEHPGINVKAIFRAGVAYVANKGAITQGGSTITQQLVKNIYVGNESNLSRKLKEAVYATTLEKYSTKEEIITAYLSHIDFGYQSYGIKNAVETYYGETLAQFNKEDRITRIVKSAFLAGLPQAPYGYSPYLSEKSRQAAIERRNTVLHNMRVQNKITEEEYEKASKVKDLLVLPKPKRQHDDEVLKYGEFVSYVLEEARETLHLKTTQEAMYSGLKIYTAFDPEVYKVMRKQMDDSTMYPVDKDGQQVETAAVFVNPQNGEVLALSGGRKISEFLKLNRAYQTYRQPGSSFKPIMDYGPALEYGLYTPFSILPGGSGATFPGGYTVKDHEGVPSRVTMVDALTHSNNVPAVFTLQQVGISQARKFAERLGITLTDNDKYLPIALGGIDRGVTPLMMADAYQAFANGGYRIPAHTIRRMVAPNGDVVHEAETALTEDKRVMKQTTADQMRFMLRSVVTSGTGVNAGNSATDQFIAGKTGTTERAGTNGNTDAWFVGFTKDYVGAIWMGFDNTTNNRYLNKTDSSWRSANLFGHIITPLLKNNPDPAVNYADLMGQKPEIKTLSVNNEVNQEERTVKLTWGIEDNTEYKVYRDGEEIGTFKDGTYQSEALEVGKEFKFQVIGYNKFTNYKVYESTPVPVLIQNPEETVTETPDATVPTTETPVPTDEQTTEVPTQATTDVTTQNNQ